MHLRNFGSHVTVLLPDCPSVRTTGTQSTGMAPKCNSRFCLEGNRMAIWTFRERKKTQKSRVFFYVIFYVYTLCYLWITEKEWFKTKETNFVGRNTWEFHSGGEKMRNASGQQSENHREAWKNKSEHELREQNFGKHIRQFLQKNNV